MFCKDYKFIEYIDSPDDIKEIVIWAELYADETPTTLKFNAVGIDGFPKNYDPELVRFAPGSFLYIVNNGDVYVADSTGTFVLQFGS